MKKKNTRKSAFSLVEVMLSILILAVIVIGGGAMMQRLGEGVVVQGKTRLAMEVANARLEVVRSQFYFTIQPTDSGAANAVYLTANDSDKYLLDKNSSETTENVVVLGRDFTMKTKVIKWSSSDVDNPQPQFASEFLDVNVSVVYGSSADQKVVLSTTLIPPGVTSN